MSEIPPYHCVYCGRELEEKQFDLEKIPRARFSHGKPMKQFECEPCEVRYIFVMRDIGSLSVREIYISKIDKP